MQTQSFIIRNPNQTSGAKKFRQISLRWIQQNKVIDRQTKIPENSSRCSVWTQEIKRMNRLYNLMVNKDLNTIRSQFNYDPVADVLKVISNCPKNLGLIHSGCLIDFVVTNFRKQYLKDQFDIAKQFAKQQISAKQRKQSDDQTDLTQQDQQKQIYDQWQNYKRAQQIKCIKGQQTKFKIDDTTFIVPALNQQTGNYKFQHHMNNSIKNPQRLSQFPSLVTKIGQQNYNLVSIWMSNVKLLNQKKQEIVINSPIKVYVKIPDGMSIQEAKKFNKYLHSTSENLWNKNTSGLNVLQKERMFQFYLDTNGSLGRQYFIKQLQKHFAKKQKKYEALIQQKRKKFIFPKYNAFQLKQNIRNQNKQNSDLYLSLSKITGKPTYFPAELRKFYYTAFKQNKNQIKFNFKHQNGTKLTFIQPIVIGKQTFYRCAQYQQFQKLFKHCQFELPKIYKQHWIKLIKWHNDHVNQQIQKQQKYIKEKYYSTNIMKQNDTANIQQNKENKIILQMNNQYKKIKYEQITIKTEFIDQFTLKRVYITQQQYQNILFNYLINQALSEKAKLKLIQQLEKYKLINTKLPGGMMPYDYKQYYKTYPNIFYNKSSNSSYKSLDFADNPIANWKWIKTFEQYYKDINGNDASAQYRIDKIRQLTQQYDKNVPKINQSDINKLFIKKQQQALKKRKQIVQKMRQKLKQYQQLKKQGKTNFPSGFQYCIKSLQKVKQFRNRVNGFSQRVINSYKSSGLPSIYGGQVPYPIYDLANRIQRKLQNLITQQQIYNCDQLMYQCSGIDVFKLYGDINFDIYGNGVTLNSNIDKIQSKGKQIDQFISNKLFTCQDPKYMQSNYYSYKEIQNFNLVNLQNQLTNIQYRLVNTFNTIVNKTVLITYGNIDNAYRIRKINTSQANNQINNIDITNIVTYKPRFPKFDSRQIQKIYVSKDRDLKIYQRQKQIANKQLQKYKQFVFQLPPKIQQFDYQKMLKILKYKKQSLQNSLSNKNNQIQKVKKLYKDIYQNRKELKNNEQKIERLTNQISNNLDLDQTRQQQIKTQIMQLRQQNQMLKKNIKNISSQINKIPAISQAQIIALKQQIQNLNRIISSYQSKKKQIQSLYKTLLSDYKNLQKLKDQGMRCETLDQAKVIRDQFDKKKQNYNNSVLTYKKLCLQPQQDEKQIKQNAEKRSKFLNKYKTLQTLVDQLNQIALKFDEKDNQQLNDLSRSIQNKINQVNSFKNVFKTAPTLISYTSHQAQNIQNILQIKKKMQNQITSAFQHINQITQINKQLLREPKYKDARDNLQGLKRGFIEKMKRKYQLKSEEYFEDVVIKFSQFKKNFNDIEKEYARFIQEAAKTAQRTR